MDMKMRHALTDTVVHRHESALCFHRFFNCPRQELRIREQWRNQIRRQICQRFEVMFWHQQAVPVKEGAVIQKCERQLIFKDNSGRDIAADDLTEKTSDFHVRAASTWTAKGVAINGSSSFTRLLGLRKLPSFCCSGSSTGNSGSVREITYA